MHPETRLRPWSVAALASLLLPAILFCAETQRTQTQQSQPAAAATTPWPLTVRLEGDRILELYPPQMDSWDGHQLKARSAVVVRGGSGTANTASDDRGTYGIVELQATTDVDKGSRTVEMSQITVTRAEFPSAGDEAQAWVTALQSDLAKRSAVESLDRFEADVKEDNIALANAAAPLRNDPPSFIFSQRPALLVTVEGAPRYTPVQGSGLERVMNTRVLLVKEAAGTHYLHVFDGWMKAATLQGPWTVLPTETAQLRSLREEAEKNQAADLLTGQSAATEERKDGADKVAPPSLTRVPVPVVHVATAPTELIVTEGKWSWTPIKGTQLMYVSNTTANILRNTADQSIYLLVSGRWFRARSETGPWTFVAANSLPADFAKIPDDSDKENVKASVAGTPQAKEAAIAATVPQTAAVPVPDTHMEAPRFDGEPRWVSITGSPLSYAGNSPTPVIRVDARTYYALENGVWFIATATKGPWVVATSVPPVIYSIPPSSPLYYVTFVRIYGSSSGTVYVGYTPGYQGTYVDPVSSVVVYGTGYPYQPWMGTTYITYQSTYGYGASVTYTPWTGWFVGFCFGWYWGAATSAWGWGWGPYPYWGPWGWGWGGWWGGAAFGPRGGVAVWGPGGWAGYSGPVYHRWGSVSTVSRYSGGFNAWTGNRWASHSGVAYNSRTGRVSAGQRGVVGNVYTGGYAAGGRGVTRGPGGVVAGGAGGTAGNVITGDSVSGGRGFVYNPATGQGTTVAGVRGDNGGVARIGDDVYAGRDGNVYRNTGDGWQKHTGDGWQPVDPSGTPRENLSGQTRNTLPDAGNRSLSTHDPELDRLSRDRQARYEGIQRDQMHQRSMESMRQSYGTGRMGGQFGGFHGGRRRR